MIVALINGYINVKPEICIIHIYAIQYYSSPKQGCMEMKDFVLNKPGTESISCLSSHAAVCKVRLYGIVTANG